jgi:hypothetical protein
MSLGVQRIVASLVYSLAAAPLTALTLEQETVRVQRSGVPAEGSATTDPDVKAITAVLDQYVAALQAKDLLALKSVWPTLNEAQQKKIRTSFDLTRFHKVQLQVKDIQLATSSAIVNCKRRDQIVTSDAVSFQREGKTLFRFVKKGSGWTIESMQ